MWTPWVKSSASNPNGECVEMRKHLTGDWHKSSASNPSGSCVEARQADGVQVRDTKYAARGETSPILSFTPAAWQAFLDTQR